MAINLPTTKIAAEKSDPKNLLIFSKPKQGKSSALAELPGALCIDLEDGGYDYIDAVKVKANSVSDIKDICKAIKEANCPYQFIVLDTITALEEMVKPMALKMYLETPAGSKFTGKISLMHQWVLDIVRFVKQWNLSLILYQNVLLM